LESSSAKAQGIVTGIMQILILYRELAAYLLPSLGDIVDKFNARITLVVYAVNPEAPYVFQSISGVRIVEKSVFLHEKMGHDFDCVFCSGWADREYLDIVNQQKKNTSKVICFDSEWKFTLRKMFGALYLRLFIKSKFDYAFVPGTSSYIFSRIMGFSNLKIFKGVYSADVEKFGKLRQGLPISQKENTRPFRFLFVGRYVREKGIHDVCNAFSKFHENTEDNWELWCVGTGPEELNCISHINIKHLGFLQPCELINILDDVDIFVMPSHSEPWGVVLHEMVLAGMPVLVSNKVNSRELFLDEGLNGLVFDSGSVNDLLDKMFQISIDYKNNREAMMSRSREISRLIMNDNWSMTIAKVVS
jgi:glycosyltransferase involved in cell wall biosynthesis